MSFYCYLGHFYHFVFWYTLILFIYFIIWKSNVTFLTTFHFSLFQKLLIFLSIKNFSSSSLSKASHFPIYQQPTSPSLKSVRILMYLKLSPFSLIPFCLFEIQTSILTLFFSFSLSHTYIYIYIYTYSDPHFFFYFFWFCFHCSILFTHIAFLYWFTIVVIKGMKFDPLVELRQMVICLTCSLLQFPSLTLFSHSQMSTFLKFFFIRHYNVNLTTFNHILFYAF